MFIEKCAYAFKLMMGDEDDDGDDDDAYYNDNDDLIYLHSL